jgi:hypothetical protein
LNHVDICDEEGNRCIKFAGAVQFSTFTRWSWIIQGVYYAAANLNDFGVLPQRLPQMLFGISLSSAFMVTSVTYCILVPGALLLPQPAHRQGAITILLSPSGHTMHLCNTAFIMTDMLLSKQSMQLADMYFGVGYVLSYLLFEILFHSYTGCWHYPFMNYNLPFASATYVFFFTVYCGYWMLGCRVSATNTAKQHSK